MQPVRLAKKQSFYQKYWIELWIVAAIILGLIFISLCFVLIPQTYGYF